MFVLTNTAGASATTPAASKTTLFVDASGVPSTKSSAGTVIPLLTGPAAALAYQPLDTDLTGIAGLTYAADKSIYYTGSAWATYDLTSVGRSLLAATTQAAQRTAIQAVGLVGNETVAGTKTFSSQVVQSLGAQMPPLQPILWSNGTDTLGNIRSGNLGTMTIAGHLGSGLNGGILLRPVSADDSTSQLFISPTTIRFSATMRPETNNAYDIGTGSERVRTYYGVNSAINTSDARLKTEPRQLSEAERRAGSELARLPAIWEWLTGDRLHAGPTVQAAMAVMKAHGLDPFAYSFICYDEWEAEPEQWHEWEEERDSEDNIVREAGRELVQAAREAGNRYSFRKEELLCFMVAALAAENDLQAAKVEALDARLAALEAKA